MLHQTQITRNAKPLIVFMEQFPDWIHAVVTKPHKAHHTSLYWWDENGTVKLCLLKLHTRSWGQIRHQHTHHFLYRADTNDWDHWRSWLGSAFYYDRKMLYITQFLFIFCFQPFSYIFFFLLPLSILHALFISVFPQQSPNRKVVCNIPKSLVLTGDTEADFDAIFVHDCYKTAKLFPNLCLRYITQD